MRPEFPNPPYVITKGMWDDYHRVQKGGSINMMMHPNIGYFCSHDAWQKSYDHFETAGNTEDLVIE